MSYSGMGAYYELSEHEVFPATSGYGEFYKLPQAGFGAVGSSGFSADDVLRNVAISDTCYGPGGTGKPSGACNVAGQKANKAVAAGLNELGYGPVAVDGSISWQGAWSQFLADHGLTPGPGFGLTKQGLLLMEQQIRNGEKPGPGKKVVYKKVNGEYVPTGEEGESMAGVGLGLLFVAAAGVGYLAYRAGKRRKYGYGTKALTLR